MIKRVIGLLLLVLGVSEAAAKDMCTLGIGALSCIQSDAGTLTANPVLGIAGSQGSTLTFNHPTAGTTVIAPSTFVGSISVVLPAVSGTLISSGTVLGGDLSGTLPNPVVVQSSNAGGFSVQGSITINKGGQTLQLVTMNPAGNLVVTLPNLIDVRSYGADPTCVSDSTTATNLAIAYVNTLNTTQGKAALHFPGGTYCYNTSTPLTRFVAGGVAIGDGSSKSFMLFGTTYAGDALSWSEAWMFNAYPLTGNTIQGGTTANDITGPLVAGMTLIGNRSASGTQNGLMFYDRDDLIYLNDVRIFYMNGYGIRTGIRSAQVISYIRESHFYDVWVWGCGNPTGLVPSVELATDDSIGASDGTDNVHVYGMDIIAPWGPGLSIRDKNGNRGVSNLYFTGLRIEGTVTSQVTTQVGDLLIIGNASDAGVGINNVFFYGTQLVQPYSGYAAVKTVAPNATYGNNMYDIYISGSIVNGTGNGINHTAGRNVIFDFVDIGTSGTNVTVGPTTGGILGTTEFRHWSPSWTASIDSTANNILTFPALVNPGLPASGFYGLGSVTWNKTPSALLPAGWYRATTGSSNTLGTDWFPILISNIAGFTATSAYSGSGGTIATSQIVEVRGSTGAPDTTTTDAAVVVQKWSGNTGATNTANPAFYASAIKTTNQPNVRVQAIFAEAQDNAGWNNSGLNNFVEGLRAHGFLNSVTLGSAYGVVAVAQEFSSTHDFLIGVESTVVNTSVTATTTFNTTSYIGAFVASSNGSLNADCGFCINWAATTAQSFVNGFYVPATGGASQKPVSNAGFKDDSSSAYGLQLTATKTTAAISTPGFTVSPSGAITGTGLISTTGGGLSATAISFTTGNGGLVLTGTQTQPNVTDTVDNLSNMTYTLLASSATNQLVTRAFSYTVVNSLTGGGHLSTMRAFDLVGVTSAGAVTTSMIGLFIEGTNSGTVTTSYAIYINSWPGTTAYGIFDATGSIWSNASGSIIVTDLYSSDATYLVRGKTTLTNGAAASVGTLTNAPAVGNPTKWIGIDDNGTKRQIPAW
jgi:hypothetical protein